MWNKIKTISGYTKDNKKEKDKVNQAYFNNNYHSEKNSPTDINQYIEDIENNNHKTSDSSQDGLANIITKANIITVMNNPKKLSWIYEVLNAIQGTENSPSLMHPKTSKNIKEQIYIQDSEFDAYIKNVSHDLTTYTKNKNMEKRLKKEKVNKINMNDSLLRCYEQVPKYYFDENYSFNFENFDRSKLCQIQEDLTENLDIVEMNLYYQIKIRFGEFLEMILRLNETEKQITNSIENIRMIKQNNTELKQKLCLPSMKILTLQKRKTNIEKTLNILSLMKKVHDVIPITQKLLDQKNFENIINFISETEKPHDNRLKSIISISQFEGNFKNRRMEIIDNYRQYINESYIGYMNETLAYVKITMGNNSLDASNLDESSLNITIPYDELDNSISTELSSRERSSQNFYLPWKFLDFCRDEKFETKLANLVVQNIKIKDTNSSIGYIQNFCEILRKFNFKYSEDMQEFVDSFRFNNQASINEGNSRISPILYTRFLMFYFGIFKRFFTRLLTLNKYLLMSILQYYDQNYMDPSSLTNIEQVPYMNEHNESQIRLLDENTIKNFSDNVNEYYNLLSFGIEFFIDHILEMLNKMRYDTMTINEFNKSMIIFEQIPKFFDVELKLNTTLQTWYQTNKSSLSLKLDKLTSKLLEKISIAPILNSRIQCEKNFIESYYKLKMNNLFTSLSKDTWQPIDIPDQYLDYFNCFFDPEYTLNLDTETKEEYPKLSSSSRLINLDLDDDTPRPIGNNEKDLDLSHAILIQVEYNKKVNSRRNSLETKRNHVNIMKNELYIDNKIYKVTSSFLFLVKAIYDFVYITKTFKSNNPIALTKLFQIIRYYNTFTNQLILEAAAIPFGIIKTITTKTLAFSGLNLALLECIIDKMHNNTTKLLGFNDESIANELKSIKTEISNHKKSLHNKIYNVLKERLIPLCGNIEKLGWQSPNDTMNMPTKYTALILSNTRSVYNQIEDYFLIEDLISFFQKILDDILHYYVSIFQNMTIDTKKTAQRVHEELNYFLSDISKLRVMNEIPYDNFEKKIQEIIKGKCSLLIEDTNTEMNT